MSVEVLAAPYADVLRRLVTGIGSDGQSRVISDGGPGACFSWPDGGGLYEIWRDDGAALDRADLRDRAVGPVRLCPSEGEVVVRWFVAVPTPAPPAPEEEVQRVIREGFAALGAADARSDTRRHPAMHTTSTLDAIIIIRGRVRLILDADERVLGPGDVVIQRGTNHAWTCEGDEPVLMAAILLQRDFRSDELSGAHHDADI